MRRHCAGMRKTKVDAIEVLSLLARKMGVAVDGCGPWRVSVVEEVVWHFRKLIDVLFRENVGGMRLGWKAIDREYSCSGGGCMGDTSRNRADTACTEPVKERGTVAG